ncbi:hypothetical protein L581_0830 [Serratia fonticola AU-AP2C]|nr:hypothetical protein L581_0830 [Serratia fonticola AU-AP2C]
MDACLWALTVLVLICNFLAICVGDKPAAIACKTSRSRRVIFS